MRSSSIPVLVAGLIVGFITTELPGAPDREGEESGKAEAAPEDFEAKVRSYLRAKFKGEAASYYAARVILMKGHEYLKPEYGLVEEGGRGKPFEATKEQVAKVDTATEKMPPEKVEKLMELLDVTAVRIDDDAGYVIEGADGEGLMTMPSRKGDVVAVARVKGHPDFVAFVFRPSGDGWKVVAEYFD